MAYDMRSLYENIVLVGSHFLRVHHSNKETMICHLVMLLVLAAICSDVFGQPLEDISGIQKLAQSTNHLAFNLHQALRTGENLFTSPLSISTAMAMLYLGTGGASALELTKTLGYNASKLEKSEVHPAFKELMTTLKDSPDDYQLNLANAMLFQSDYPVLEEYSKSLQEYYDALIKPVNFANASALKEVNSWFSDKTQGKIKEFLKEPLGPYTRMLLLNAVYFKGSWLTKFDPEFTRNSTFRNQGMVPVTVPMMYMKGHFKYADFPELDCQLLELPYQGKDISMVVVLPNSHTGISNLINKMTSQVLNRMINNMYNETVHLSLPQFRLESDLKLKPALRKLGIRSVFSSRDADLSGITEKNDLYVENVLHHAVVEVDEEGSEATGATAVVITLKSFSPHPIFMVDRPFLFIIRDNRSGMILFMGEVNKL